MYVRVAYSRRYVWKQVLEKMCSGLLALVCLCYCTFHDVSGAVDSASLLWPTPTEVTTTSNRVRALDTEKFYFTTDINSALLNAAFQRYKGIIFQAPVPFYPDGAAESVTVLMPMLNVKVTSGDETLKPDTDESCETIIMNSLT